MIIFATLGCLIAVGVLLFAEYAQSRLPSTFPRLRIGAKLVASAAFVAVAATTLGKDVDGDRASFDRWILVGLALGAVGDAALLGRGKRAFVWGLGAFLAGHVAYLIAIWLVVDPRYWLALAGWIGLAPIVAASYAHEWLKPHLGPLRLAVGGYILVITAMVVAAIAIARSGLLPDGDSLCLAAGACLFFASDLAVARDRFVARELTNKLWGLPAYYIGQLLIAWAIAA